MVNSTVPLAATFFHSVLAQLATHPEGVRRVDLYELVADAMNLSPSQRAERLPGLTHLRYRHRIGWSMHLLMIAGLIQSPNRGICSLTQEGERLLAAHPNGFAGDVNRSIIREARAKRSRGDGVFSEPNEESPGETSFQQTPEERIETGIREMRDAVAGELLDRVVQSPPTFFELLVLDLLHALGYGTCTEDLQHVGRSGDGGIDGVISLDKLGFEKVYVQAKRWQGMVGRPEVQAFFGALAGRRAKKGVFITTSTFTKEALAFAGAVSDSIVLIDGTRLTDLMIDYGVGVSHYRTILLPRIDGDYFES